MPALLGLYSLVTLSADDLHSSAALLLRAVAWYSERAATFGYALSAVRRALWV